MICAHDEPEPPERKKQILAVAGKVTVIGPGKSMVGIVKFALTFEIWLIAQLLDIDAMVPK